MNKKKIAIIFGAVIVVAIIIVSICLVGGQSGNPNATYDTATPDGIVSLSSDDEAKREKEYEELKEKVKDIYDYEPVRPFSFSVDGEQHDVKDAIAFFNYFPSQTIKNKEGNEIKYKDELYEVKNNLKDFNHNIFTEEDMKQAKDEGHYPEKNKYFSVEFQGYNYTDDDYKDSFYEYRMYENSKHIALVSNEFSSKEEYYQACYDVILEMIKNRPKNLSIMDCMVSEVDDVCTDSIEESVKNGDYSILFDALMNQTFAFIYTDENGIWYRVEFSDYRLSDDFSERSTALYITSQYTFDDEDKYM